MRIGSDKTNFFCKCGPKDKFGDLSGRIKVPDSNNKMRMPSCEPLDIEELFKLGQKSQTCPYFDQRVK